MMRVLFDTDIALDVLLNRQPFAAEAAALWIAAERQQIMGFVTPVTCVNVFYIMRRQPRSAEIARAAIGDILMIMQLCPVDRGIVDAAYALPMPDFEDAVQAAAAHAAALDAIVTRNTVDFTGAPVPVLTSAELLARLTQLS